jgi:predicted AAA+ superfamily ATPase
VLDRPAAFARLANAVRRSPITALLGPRQCGKSTLARRFADGREASSFDLESPADVGRLANPELALGSLRGLVILDEIQALPGLLPVLRVLADRPRTPARFLVLGSASPAIVRGASETLAGRVEFVELGGFDLGEAGPRRWERLWGRGGFPRSFLARSDADSLAWREGFVRTFLERDIPQLGIGIPAAALRRFWTMLAHSHGQTWNGSDIGRSMGLTDKTVRSYLDLLTGTYMVRQLQPWFENVAKRQVKAPKIYFRDTGVLHHLLSLPDRGALLGHPGVGASFEGFVIEQILSAVAPGDAYFWATHGGAELDLLLVMGGRRYGVEIKLAEKPAISRSMRVAMEDLGLSHLYVVYPGRHVFPLEERITAFPVASLNELTDLLKERDLSPSTGATKPRREGRVRTKRKTSP